MYKHALQYMGYRGKRWVYEPVIRHKSLYHQQQINSTKVTPYTLIIQRQRFSTYIARIWLV